MHFILRAVLVAVSVVAAAAAPPSDDGACAADAGAAATAGGHGSMIQRHSDREPSQDTKKSLEAQSEKSSQNKKQTVDKLKEGLNQDMQKLQELRRRFKDAEKKGEQMKGLQAEFSELQARVRARRSQVEHVSGRSAAPFIEHFRGHN
mmetsp:Transcript_8401/g.15452  ORF Transcript_8401/g.15452 Transcript_8401/m.15452 type:complete len:148 (+) Transcript_8401:82-525(+)